MHGGLIVSLQSRREDWFVPGTQPRTVSVTARERARKPEREQERECEKETVGERES